MRLRMWKDGLTGARFIGVTVGRTSIGLVTHKRTALQRPGAIVVTGTAPYRPKHSTRPVGLGWPA